MVSYVLMINKTHKEILHVSLFDAYVSLQSAMKLRSLDCIPFYSMSIFYLCKYPSC